jgi:hypothetical protein
MHVTYLLILDSALIRCESVLIAIYLSVILTFLRNSNDDSNWRKNAVVRKENPSAYIDSKYLSKDLVPVM